MKIKNEIIICGNCHSFDFRVIHIRKPNWVYNHYECNTCRAVDNILRDDKILRSLKINKIIDGIRHK